jgi:hypothetical protein
VGENAQHGETARCANNSLPGPQRLFSPYDGVKSAKDPQMVA